MVNIYPGIASIDGFRTSGTGPVFIMEPAQDIEISSRSKGVVIDCLVHGDPEPLVSWHHTDGRTLDDKSVGSNGMFKILGNNSLYLQEYYAMNSLRQQDGVIKSSGLICKATNKFGTIVSPPVHINAGKCRPFFKLIVLFVN